MSSTASNYDLGRLNVGISLATISVCIVLWSAFGLFLQTTASAAWITLMSVAYSIMMFASSYVEEEQHFWHWLVVAWLAWLFIRQWVIRLTIITC